MGQLDPVKKLLRIFLRKSLCCNGCDPVPRHREERARASFFRNQRPPRGVPAVALANWLLVFWSMVDGSGTPGGRLSGRVKTQFHTMFTGPWTTGRVNHPLGPTQRPASAYVDK